MYHPEYTRLDTASEMAEALTPVYPATEGISQSRYRSLATQALALLGASPLADLLESKEDYNLNDALRFLHRPPPNADTDRLMAGNHPVQARLAFEELIALGFEGNTLVLPMPESET